MQENMREIQHRSMLIQKPSAAVLRPDPAVVGAAGHNYSIQTFNSHRRATELLRKEMAKVWKLCEKYGGKRCCLNT